MSVNPNKLPEALMRVMQITPTFSGEVGYFPVGTKVILLRLAGCNLRCEYCDTPVSQNAEKGETYTVEALTKKLVLLSEKTGITKILVTGGEPLLQITALEVLFEKMLYTCNFDFQIETNGSIFPDRLLLVSPFVYFCIDIKHAELGNSQYVRAMSRFFEFSIDPLHVNRLYYKVPVRNMKEFNEVSRFIEFQVGRLLEENNMEACPTDVVFGDTFDSPIYYSPVFYLMGKEEKEEFVKQLSTYMLAFNHFSTIPCLKNTSIGLNFQSHKTWDFA